MPLRRPADCACSPLQARRYRARFGRELGSHIAICLDVAPAAPAGRPPDRRRRTPSPRRASPKPATAPTAGSGHPLAAQRRHPRRAAAPLLPAPAEALAPVSRAVDLGEISARAAHQVIRVAWTLADLAGPRPARTNAARHSPSSWE